MKEQLLEAVSAFQQLGICSSRDGGPQEELEMRMEEGLKTFSARKMILNARSVSLGMKRELFETVVVPTKGGSHSTSKKRRFRSRSSLQIRVALLLSLYI